MRAGRTAIIPSDGAEREGEVRSSFVDRRTYRRRRLMDLSRMMPMFGGFLFVLPLMWSHDADTDHAWSMSSVVVYVFSVWAALVLLSLLFGMAVRRWAYHWIDAPHAPADDLEGP